MSTKSKRKENVMNTKKDVNNNNQKETLMSNLKKEQGNVKPWTTEKLMTVVFGHQAKTPQEWCLVENGEITISLGNYKSITVDYNTGIASYFGTDGHREVSLKNQGSRSDKLKEFIEDDKEGNKSSIIKIAKQLVNWDTRSIPCDVWGIKELITEDDDIDPIFREEGVETSTEFIKEETALRRSMPLNNINGARLIKIADTNKWEAREEAEIAAEELDNMDTNECGIHNPDKVSAGTAYNGDAPKYLLNNTRGNYGALLEIARYYESEGMEVYPGSPSGSILIAVPKGTFPKTVSGDAANKLGKVLLRGGIQLEGEDLRLKVIDFPTKGKDRRDGLYLVLKRGVQSMLARNNNLNNGHVNQGHLVEHAMRLYAKGLTFGATKSLKSSMDLIKHAGDCDGVIDRATITAYFGTTIEDEIYLPANALWVMASSGGSKSRKKNINLSSQAVRRAPKVIADWIMAENMKQANALVDAGKSKDKRELLPYFPNFGNYSIIKKANLRPWLNKEGEVDTYLNRTVLDYLFRCNRKGYQVKGWTEYIVHDGERTWNPKTGTVGLSVPKSWGLMAGDRVIVARYPILPALRDNKSTGIGVVYVENVHNEDFVGINPEAQKTMLGDEDGDQSIFIPTDLPANGILDIDLSTRVGKKHKLFTAEDTVENRLKVFLKLRSDVGVVDNTATSLMLEVDKESETPTGEELTIYLSKVIQHSIESMKHSVDDIYSFDNMREWVYSIGGSLKTHPELKVAKLRNPATRTFEGITIKMLKEALNGDALEMCAGTSPWLEMMQKSSEFDITEEGFVDRHFYRNASIDLHKEVKGYINNEETRKKLMKLAGYIKKTYFVRINIDGIDVANKWLRNTGKDFRMALPKAESLYLMAALGYSTRTAAPSVWLTFGDVEYATLLSKHAEGAPLSELGFTGRNKTKASRTMPELDRGYITIRVWSKDYTAVKEGDKLTGVGTTAVVLCTGDIINFGDKSEMPTGVLEVVQVTRTTKSSQTLVVRSI